MGGDKLGSGQVGNLGNTASTSGNNLSSVDLGTGLTAKVVRTGRYMTCAILNNNKIKCWGANGWGNLGTGNSNNYGQSGATGDSIPFVDVGTGLTPVDIGMGENYACALFSDGRGKCWGNASLGQQGLGNSSSSGGNAGSMGDNRPFLNVGSGRTIKQLVLGPAATTCAVLDNDTLKCWGLNTGANLGVGHGNNVGDNTGETGDGIPVVDLGTGVKVRNVQVGDSHVCAHLFDNTVKCWGASDRGQLGQEGMSSLGTSLSEMGDALPTVNFGAGKTVRQLAGGDLHSCVILNDNTVKCWGFNAWGQLGTGDTTNRGIAAGDMGDNLPAVNLGTGFIPERLTVGASETCAISTDKKIKCWGQNASGQLGLGDTTHRGGSSSTLGDHLPVLDLGTGF
jgi:alpha-tubulin suppressor-like RCC1 family protein